MDNEDETSFEFVLSKAIAAHERGGETLLQEVFAKFPAYEERIRKALGRLLEIDMLADSSSGIYPKIDDFQLGKELGAGGMGIVFCARQISLKRDVALKLIRPEHVLLDGARQRFAREIEAVASLEHPALVPILSSGAAGETPYYVMPRLSGINGEQIIAALKGQRTEDLSGSDLLRVIDESGSGESSDDDGVFAGSYCQAVTRLIRKAALGIQHAHGRGVLHRDLKPSNLMFSANGEAIVLDFGLARLSGQHQLTRTGASLGSPLYMAPEQLRGLVADERTDVYGLAITLYTLIALQAPFAADEPLDVRQRILHDNKKILAHVAKIPADLSLVVACGMETDRDRRYDSAQAFAADLLAVLEERAIAARPLPKSIRIARFVQRHRPLSAALLATLIFVVSLPLLLFIQSEKANARLQEEVERADSNVLATIGAFRLMLTGEHINNLTKIDATLPVVAEMLSDADDAMSVISSEKIAGNARTEVNDFRVTMLVDLMEVESKLWRDQEAKETADKILKMTAASSSQSMGLHRAEALLMLAISAQQQGDYDEVAVLCERAKPVLDCIRTDKPDSVPFSASYKRALIAKWRFVTLTARVRELDGQIDEAEQFYRKAVEIDQQLSGSSTPQAKLSGLNLIKFLRRQERLDDAFQVVAEMRTALQAVLGESASGKVDKEQWPTSKYLMGEMLMQQSRIQQQRGEEQASVIVLKSAVQAFTSSIADHPAAWEALEGRGLARLNLAIGLMRNDNATEAANFALRALDDLIEVRRIDGGSSVFDTLRMKCAQIIGACSEAPPALEMAARHITATGDPACNADAIAWLKRAIQLGQKIDLTSADFAPLANEEEFLKLRERK